MCVRMSVCVSVCEYVYVYVCARITHHSEGEGEGEEEGGVGECVPESEPSATVNCSRFTCEEARAGRRSTDKTCETMIGSNRKLLQIFMNGIYKSIMVAHRRL